MLWALTPVIGNTSTDVEKTRPWRFCSKRREKHLHGRGEDSGLAQKPRDRGRNTSTDVEKTISGLRLLVLVWKHLHGRGEDV